MSGSIYIHGTSDEEHKRLSILNALLNKRCIGKVGIRIGDHILDVGSGLGQFTRMMAIESGLPGKVLGIERDAQQMYKAKEIARAEKEEFLVEFRQGDAYKLPLTFNEWESFDIAHSRFVLEHVRHPDKVLTQMIKSLKNGGRLIVSDDDHATLKITPENDKINKLWMAYYLSFEKIGNDPYIGRKLVSYLHALGLKNVKNDMVFFGCSADQSEFKDFAYNFRYVIKGAEQNIMKNNLMTRTAFDAGIEALKKWELRTDAAIWYTLCWAEGTKV